MALIAQFEPRPLAPRRLHSKVTCGYGVVEVEGTRVLQLETYGTVDREIPGKVSQSLQLDEAAARELKQLLDSAFPSS